jgi:hypothetical protein
MPFSISFTTCAYIGKATPFVLLVYEFLTIQEWAFIAIWATNILPKE